jgi:hypothetical protein
MWKSDWVPFLFGQFNQTAQAFLLAPRPPITGRSLHPPDNFLESRPKRTKAKVTQVSEVQRWRRGLALQLAELIRLAGGQHGFYIWTAPLLSQNNEANRRIVTVKFFSLHARPGLPSTTLEPNAIGSSNQLSKGAAGNSNVSSCPRKVYLARPGTYSRPEVVTGHQARV